MFTDGWAPTITEPELMGFSSSSENSEIEDESIPISVHVVRDETVHTPIRRTHVQDPDSSDADDLIHSHHMMHSSSPNINTRNAQNSSDNKNNHHLHNTGTRLSSSPSPIESLERDSPTGHHHPHIPTHHANDIEQVEWLADLHARNAKIVKVLFPRSANNEKELTVVR